MLLLFIVSNELEIWYLVFDLNWNGFVSVLNLVVK